MLQIEPDYFGQSMAEPDTNHLCQLMRHVYENYEEAKAKAVYGREDISKRFSPQRIAELIDQQLEKYLNGTKH